MAFKIFNTLFLIAFVLCTIVQFNDPDAPVWIAVYAAAAALCMAEYRKKLPRWLPALLLVASVVWIGTLLPAFVGKVSPHEIFDSLTMKTKAVEEAREAGGLLLVIIWSAVMVARR